MKFPLGWCCVVVAACGYHDTPVASYRDPLAGGATGVAGAPNSGAGGSDVVETGGQADAGAAGAVAQPLCMQTYPIVVDGLTSRYKQGAAREVWVAAERDCESEGAHLVVIDDEVENAWVAQIASQSLTNDKSSHQLAWLGLTDQEVEGDFRWVTGATLGLSKWFTDEPNSLYQAEDCAEMRASGAWNDDRCNAQLAYVCECDGLPSAGAWCDTDDVATCGDCSTVCAAGQTCSAQICK